MRGFIKSIWLLAGMGAMAAAGIYYLLVMNVPRIPLNIKNQTSTTEAQNNFEPIVTPSPIPSPTSIPIINRQTATMPNRLPGGKISCDYQIPAGPGTYGTAKITAVWNNLSQPLTTVCVSVNGQSPTLMSQDNLATGSRDIYATWIARTANYSFNLYNGKCTGTIISTCRIDTN
jgi:hypothetical protein